jgi:hypothetical protein
MAFNYSPKVVTDGLVLYLDAANPNSYVSGSTTWRDISRGGSIGTLTNGPTYSSANGGSIVFDGTNDYVTLGSSSLFTLGNNFTLNSWVYPTSVGSSNGDEIFSLATGVGSPFISYGLEWMNNNKFRFSIGNTSDVFLTYQSTDTYTLNNWYNVMGTYNGSTVVLYINGILQNSTSISTTIKYANNILTIGTWNYDISPSNAFAGRIPIIQLYNRALSATEIRQNYNATKTRFGLT